MLTTKKAVFICGCARSGTTLLGSLLGGASGCITTPESQFVTDTVKKISRNKIGNTYQEVRNNFLNNFRFKLWDISAEIQNLPCFDGKDPLADLTWQSINLYALKVGKESWNTWIDHTPTHIDYINPLAEKFPNSYFIHLVRDGRGVFSSVKSLDWGPNGVIEGSKWWASRVAIGLAAEQKKDKRIIRVYFEDLVRKPEEELRKICQFIDIEFDPLIANGGGFSVPEYTKNQHTMIGKPPDKSICDKWKNHLSPREIEIFENLSRPMLEYLEYEPIYGITAKRPKKSERWKEKLFLTSLGGLVDKFHKNKRSTRI